MKAIAPALILALALLGCFQHQDGRAVLKYTMRGVHIDSVRDLKYREGGLREQVYEFFFYATPLELKEAVAKAGFVRDDSIVEVHISNAHRAFKESVGVVEKSGVIGFRRSDLTPKDGKYCELLCSRDFSWAYLVYVDSRSS
jgi:hypothetical protein